MEEMKNKKGGFIMVGGFIIKVEKEVKRKKTSKSKRTYFYFTYISSCTKNALILNYNTHKCGSNLYSESTGNIK